MECTPKLIDNIVYNCSPAERAKAGLETKAVIINRSDLDLTALTTSGASVTNISLASGATGYSIDWIKNLGSATSAYAANDSGVDTFTQGFSCRVFGQGANDAEIINQLGKGEFVVVIETKWKGTSNADAFKVFGLENGLRMSEGNYSTLENDGSYIFTLSSVEGFGETYPYQVWKEGAYSVLKAKFDNLMVD